MSQFDITVFYTNRLEKWSLNGQDVIQSYANTKSDAKRKALAEAQKIADRENRVVELGVYKKSDGELQTVKEARPV